MSVHADAGVVRCDGLGCRESHPLDHEALGEECFGTGRWCGWLYLDLNRPDLYSDVMRFCSVACCMWWLEKQTMNQQYERRRNDLTPLDRALRRPNDEVARKRAGLGESA